MCESENERHVAGSQPKQLLDIHAARVFIPSPAVKELEPSGPTASCEVLQGLSLQGGEGGYGRPLGRGL